MASGTTYEASLKIDVASEVWGVRPGEQFVLALTSSLRADGKPDPDYWEPDSHTGRGSLVEQYEYAMCGKVFKYEYVKDRQVGVVASFGGLLMLLIGDQRHLVRISLDQKVYALIKKVGASTTSR